MDHHKKRKMDWRKERERGRKQVRKEEQYKKHSLTDNIRNRTSHIALLTSDTDYVALHMTPQKSWMCPRAK
ncbi:hypothetical protein XELAEV_18020250mg [Xenopus laevis]|uniref:Uncharacterized protein n=1 Tax=Xenopus laevis TaxID=8355 RepID=A0A974D6V3_XENLA|nr:hypothetical protein XELAEV_18020250mg [Xenopus laevis]